MIFKKKGDLSALADVAHSIKGMAGHFCADPIVKLSKELEDSARAGKTQDYEGLTNALIESVSKLIQRIKT